MGADQTHQLRPPPLNAAAVGLPAADSRPSAGHARLYWTLQLAGWAAFALVSFLTLLPTVPASIVPRLAATKLTRGAWGLGISHCLHVLYRRLAASKLRAAPALVLTGFSVVTLGVVWYVAFYYTARLWAPAGSPGIDWPQLPHASWDSVVILGAWSAAHFAIRAWRQADISARQVSAATARADRAQLDTLRYQLNPHFLFNALSSIRALISEDQNRARTMVTSFADMLRRSLDDSVVAEIPLGDEIAALEQYLAIERMRFESALDVTLDVTPVASASLVPTFLLHPLVENAIAHGRPAGQEPLRIRIRADATPQSLWIEVANSGSLAARSDSAADADPNPGSGSHGRRPLGVASVRERLALLYPHHHQFSLAQDGPWVRATIEIDRPAPTPALAG